MKNVVIFGEHLSSIQTVSEKLFLREKRCRLGTLVNVLRMVVIMNQVWKWISAASLSKPDQQATMNEVDGSAELDGHQPAPTYTAIIVSCKRDRLANGFGEQG